MTETRTAHVRGPGATETAIARYLPSNYTVVGTAPDGAVIITGHDVAGWTFDDYVKPRLSSGLYGAEEVA